MQKEVFDKLFDGYLQNTLSESELKKLMRAINENEHDSLLKEKIDTSFNENLLLDQIDPLQSDKILNQILSQPINKPAALIPFKNKKRKTAIRFVLAAASILILVASGSRYFVKTEFSLPDTLQKQENTSPNPILSFTGKQLIHLPDGSTILLNENSTIEYNQISFNENNREVILTGEAYFDIKRNESKPFIVHTGRVQTKVLGTAFNINAYGNSNKIEVTVTRGKVQVGDLQRTYGIITPNQQIKVNKNTLDFQQNNVNAALAVEWKSNYLILDNISMEEAILLISQKYKVPITLSNDNIKKCRITASFLNNENLDHILKVVSSVIELEYHYNKNGTIILEGKGCE